MSRLLPMVTLPAVSLLALLALFSNPSQILSKTHHVQEIVDGDTYVIEDKIIVRMFSVDAPELTQCGGQEAKDALKKLILNRYVTLDTKVRDPYGRLTSTTFVGVDFVDKKMLEGGFARYYPHNYERKDELIAASQKARQQKLGIWSEKCTQTVNKANPSCQIKGNISTSDKKKYYHFPGCGRYQDVIVELHRGDQWFCSEKEAQSAGFTKSKNCHNLNF